MCLDRGFDDARPSPEARVVGEKTKRETVRTSAGEHWCCQPHPTFASSRSVTSGLRSGAMQQGSDFDRSADSFEEAAPAHQRFAKPQMVIGGRQRRQVQLLQNRRDELSCFVFTQNVDQLLNRGIQLDYHAAALAATRAASSGFS